MGLECGISSGMICLESIFGKDKGFPFPVAALQNTSLETRSGVQIKLLLPPQLALSCTLPQPVVCFKQNCEQCENMYCVPGNMPVQELAFLSSRCYERV